MKKHNEDLWDFRSDKGDENTVQESETANAPEVTSDSPNTEEAPANPNTSKEKTEEELSFEQTNAIEGQDFIVAHRRRSRHAHSRHSYHSHHHSSHSANHHSDSPLPDDNVDDYVFAHYRKHKSSHHHHNDKLNDSDYVRNEENKDTLVVRSTTYSRGKKKNKSERKWKKRPWWQKLLIILGWILGILLLLALIAIITIMVLGKVGKKELTSIKGMNMTAPSIQSVEVQLSDNGKTVTYNGQKYRYNDDMATILCIGVDKFNINEEYDASQSLSEVGQSDALYLVALDTDDGDTTVFSIPRDTMTDIGIYDQNGKFLQTDKRQICQAYAYGDGKEFSCDNTVTAVSRLFSGLPIQTYFAIDLSAIAPLNDTVGGVTITMIDNSFYDINLVHHFKGETLTLYGDNARKYVQQRDVDYLESTTDRLERQITYLKAFSSKALAMTKKDITTPVSLYNVISSNSITNLNASKITALATCLIDNGVENLDFRTVPGTLTSGGTYAEYNVDEQKLYEMILETYYTPVS
ncbi:MAG: LCP family protein [Ruminococcus sp.]|nr:LCP family protein [Ruminococcus sp.]